MEILASLLVALVAIEHVYILILEMFLWTKPKGRKVFGMSVEEAESTKVMAANQGLYNVFLAAGLFWGLLHPNAETALQIQLFFVSCVLVAGLYGGATANKVIYKVQALPAALALTAVLVNAFV
ncbi:DUF1304 domain-containing protein [Oceaniserpentilla sp. 4NH20-0058]|uniref:DUF1304 domain-containing protein n=1 Tax=Oceaniserpentilla sp. 4NH20-0058 TaxID=3127660 RepID=UPI00310C20B2